MHGLHFKYCDIVCWLIFNYYYVIIRCYGRYYLLTANEHNKVIRVLEMFELKSFNYRNKTRSTIVFLLPRTS